MLNYFVVHIMIGTQGLKLEDVILALFINAYLKSKGSIELYTSLKDKAVVILGVDDIPTTAQIREILNKNKDKCKLGRIGAVRFNVQYSEAEDKIDLRNYDALNSSEDAQFHRYYPNKRVLTGEECIWQLKLERDAAAATSTKRGAFNAKSQSSGLDEKLLRPFSNQAVDEKNTSATKSSDPRCILM